MSPLRSWVVGQVATRRDQWAFRKTFAEWCRCSVRTVQRALTQAKALGLIGIHRGKKNETPPNAKGPIPCGWSHRFAIGWGEANAAVNRLIARARLAWITRDAKRKAETSTRNASAQSGRGTSRILGSDRGTPAGRSFTTAELDAELERLARERAPT